MQFSLLDLEMRQHELYPPHMINVAVLHCESQKTLKM